jgi:hypothetical protein
MITTRAMPALLPAHHRRVATYQAITEMTLPTPCEDPDSSAAPE